MNKLICFIFSLVFIISFSVYVFAEENDEVRAVMESLEERLKIPEDYANVKAEKYEATYGFEWENQEGESIDAYMSFDGSVITYRNFAARTKLKVGWCTYEECVAIADEWIKRTLPKLASQMHFERVDKGPDVYTYVVYNRKINGILLDWGNRFSVRINRSTGEVYEHQLGNSWSDIMIPEKPEKIIDEVRAGELLLKETGFKLKYVIDSELGKATPIYMVEDEDADVDAVTGERANLNYYMSSGAAGGASSGGYSGTSDASNNVAESTDNDEFQVDRSGVSAVKGLISVDEVLELMKKETDTVLPDVEKIHKIRYGYSPLSGYYVNVSFDSYGTVTFDAKSGELQDITDVHVKYIHASSPSMKNLKSHNELRSIADKFLKKHFKDTSCEFAVKEGEDYGWFIYTKTVNGVEVHRETITIGVDPRNGKICEYENYIDEQEWEYGSLDGIISPEEAWNTFIKAQGIKLTYGFKSYAEPIELGLAYKLAEGPEPYIGLVFRVDAKTGKLLNWKNEEFTYEIEVDEDEEEERIALSKIEGHWAIDAMKELLYNHYISADRLGNIDEEVSKRTIYDIIEYISWNSLEKSGIGERTWDSVTREDAVRYIMKLYGYSGDEPEISEIPLGFSDESEISPNNVGFIKLAKKIGIISGYGDGSFKPKKNITVAEFATILYNTMTHGNL